MIKINLLRSRAHTEDDADFAVNQPIGGHGMLSKAEQIEIMKKALVFCIGIGILIGYEWYNIDIQAQVAKKASQQLQNEKRGLQAKKEELKQYADVEEQSKVLEEKISILKALSKIRLREVKSLDFIQSIAPDAVWFQTINYQDQEYRFEGFSVTDDALSALIRELESSIYFTEVILLKAFEVKAENGTVKSFTIQAKVGEVS